MTYGQFLILFLLVPIMGLAFLVVRDALSSRMQKVTHSRQGQERIPWLVLVVLVVVAIAYTIPWDNHLIGERVWWYDPALVSRVTLGWIPLEELLFFILQTILIELWVMWLIPRAASHHLADLATSAIDGTSEDGSLGNARKVGIAVPTPRHAPAHGRGNGIRIFRWMVVVVSTVIWLFALVILLREWRPGTYLGWELVWALPPLIAQLWLGGDLLWRYRRLLLATLVPAIVYLSVADGLAIRVGIWTVSPYQSLGLLLGGVLPVEELIFFALTSMLVAFGLVLGDAPQSRWRFLIRT